MGLGLVPGVIVAIALAGVFVAIALWVDDWSRAIAAEVSGDDTPNGLLVFLVALSIIGGAALLSVFAFTALTLLIGQPFFEHISDLVARNAGLEPTAEEEPWWRSTLRGVGEGAKLLAFGGAVGISMFFVGLVPVIGAATAFVVSALIGGSLVALELTAYPLARRGVFSLKERRALFRENRALGLGFGVVAYLLCLLPLGAVISMPALVAGSTLLAARLATNAVGTGTPESSR